MGRLKTKFEQVPVALARKVLQMEDRESRDGEVSCVICGVQVQLENCKIDEVGRAVHEGCYLSRMAQGQRRKAGRSRLENPKRAGERESL